MTFITRPGIRGRIALSVAVLVTFGAAHYQLQQESLRPRRMSFHNRLLLNRAAIGGLKTLEVMLLVTPGGLARISETVQRDGGRVQRTNDAIGYLLVELPIDKLLELVSNSAVDAYQISSLSRGSWYRDGPPQTNAEMFRAFERVIPNPESSSAQDLHLPLLTPELSRQSGYSGGNDSGVADWLQKHPTFDGRGITIALLESAQPEFAHPTVGMAKSLDGQDLPKIAGILNAIDIHQPDDTRVQLNAEIHAKTAWNRLGDRTYTVPHPGNYHLGIFTLPVEINLNLQFAVLQNDDTQEIWVDTNGDADFRDETPIADVNERFDVRFLKLTYPRRADLSFVLARGRAPHIVNIYVSRGSHQAMTLSVAAGSRTRDGLAYGVAPGARVLLVRNGTADSRLSDFVEGYIEAAERPDVDLLSDSDGIGLIPDTASDFMGLLFHRLTSTFGKPIFHAAGNFSLTMSNLSAASDAFSVGGSIGREAFAALYGGAPLANLMVHPISAAGPSIDGVLKPDFIAPVHRLSANLFLMTKSSAIPQNAPQFYLPPEYQISCCTSSSGPYAAGIGALLLSAMKQQSVPYSFAAFSRALRIGARFLPTFQSHEQGNGVLDVGGAWEELERRVDLPRMTASAHVVHPLAQYAARGEEGQGLFERDGWHPGMTGQRIIRLTRESGPSESVTYPVTWTANDGTFTTDQAISLGLNQTTALPLHIAVRSAGAHGAMLNLHDPSTHAIVFRTQATVVGSEQFNQGDHTVRLTGALPLLGHNSHYLDVPDGTSALSLELEVLNGSMHVYVAPPHGLISSYYPHVYPIGRIFPKGKYHVVYPNPTPGTWSVSLGNVSTYLERNQSLVSTDEARYIVTARLLSVSLESHTAKTGALEVAIENTGATLKDGVVETSLATVITHAGETLPTGLPNRFDIDVPDHTTSLAFDLRSKDEPNHTFELYLYDCTSGECFSYNFTVPASDRQRLVLRNPKAGRWVAAVNAAPFPTGDAHFDLSVMTAADTTRYPAPQEHTRSPGAKWTQTIGRPAVASNGQNQATVLLVEVVDAAVELDQDLYPWETRAKVPKLADRPVALGTTIQRLR
jgi:hypothetical protein